MSGEAVGAAFATFYFLISYQVKVQCICTKGHKFPKFPKVVLGLFAFNWQLRERGNGAAGRQREKDRERDP